jgi:hypothetical protein
LNGAAGSGMGAWHDALSMRVLLVYTNQSRELVPAPPVGLAYVASAARAAGHEARLLDLAFSARLPAELAEAIDAFVPQVLGFSVRNIDNVVHQRFDSPLVLGGPAISILGARALEVFDAEHAVIGEGEEAFTALLAALARGAAPAGIPGVCSRGAPGSQASPVAPRRQPSFGASGMQQWGSGAATSAKAAPGRSRASAAARSRAATAYTR